eukprot:351479-Chlamydomonas_euryale.AAC.1
MAVSGLKSRSGGLQILHGCGLGTPLLAPLFLGLCPQLTRPHMMHPHKTHPHKTHPHKTHAWPERCIHGYVEDRKTGAPQEAGWRMHTRQVAQRQPDMVARARPAYSHSQHKIASSVTDD